MQHGVKTLTQKLPTTCSYLIVGRYCKLDQITETCLVNCQIKLNETKKAAVTERYKKNSFINVKR